MLEDLKDLSEDYVRENREMARHGYQGSLKPVSPVGARPNQSAGVPYGESQTSRRQDAAVQDPYVLETRYAPQPGYSSAPSQGGYPSAGTGFPDGSKYPLTQAPGYPPVPGYPPSRDGYPPGYGQGPGYPSASGYPVVSGYASAGYPATAGRPGMPNEQNYTYADQAGEYSSQGYQYGRAGAYPGGAPPRDPRAAPGYPYVSASQDAPMRGAPIDERYDAYVQSMPQSQPGRGPFVTSRGTPVYDPPPQPRDGYPIREPIRDDRRRGR